MPPANLSWELHVRGQRRRDEGKKTYSAAAPFDRSTGQWTRLELTKATTLENQTSNCSVQAQASQAGSAERSIHCSAVPPPCNRATGRRWMPELAEDGSMPMANILTEKGMSSHSVQVWNLTPARRPLQLALLSALVGAATGQSCSSSSTCPDHANDKESSCFFKGVNNMWGYSQAGNMNFPVSRP